jgi:cellulose synthase catalytic subunit (UDP-forming)
MTVTGLWQDIGAGENIFTRIFRFLFLAVAACVFIFLALLPLTWPQQAVLGFFGILLALIAASVSESYLVTLTLMMLSLFSTFRYGVWRVLQVDRSFHDPAHPHSALNIALILCLLLAEFYAFGVLVLGYFQTIWPLRRAPVALPDNPDDWPDIDVLITTVDEPLDIVRFTALGAVNMDWPVDKLHVYILDDGRREEFKQFAHAAGIGYITRQGNEHAKAGNINNALKTATSPLVVIFDADHVPTRSFLQMTAGWFLRDLKLAVLQTPHHFYSPDPFERNLHQFRIIPNEGEFFYGIVQDGNDLWNSSFFCGSCAVLRRSALDEIGGIATETVTEDAHTSLRLQMQGWNSAYVNIPQAAGLATSRLSAHVRQRIRWARGMVQILRTENPLFAPGLTFAQRVCYFNAMAHFLYAIPRLIFLTAPLAFLLLHRSILPGFWLAILAYALPHLVLAVLTNSRIQGEHRYSFWNEIYETVLSPYILFPTLIALLTPRFGKYTVTTKGDVIQRTFFDSRIAQPFLLLLLLNLTGLAVAVPRYLYWNCDQHGAILFNVLWCGFNVIILGVCIAVARELQQRRTAMRVPVASPLTITLPDGETVSGETLSGETFDISNGGVGLTLEKPIGIAVDSTISLVFRNAIPSTELPASVVSSDGVILRVRFNDLSIAQQEALTIALYSRADSWLGWGEAPKTDNILRSLAHIFSISIRGVFAALGSIFTGNVSSKPERSSSGSNPLSIARTSILLLAAALSCAAIPKSFSQSAQPNSAVPSAPLPKPAAGSLNAASATASAPLPPDLKSLPSPFLNPLVDTSSSQPANIAIVFPAQPSFQAIQAAGIVASYFGLVSESSPVRFPVAIGAIPAGEAILIAEDPSAIPAALNLGAVSAPIVAIRANPGDPNGQVLILTGPNADAVITAAQAVALASGMLSGAQTSIDNFKLPAPRSADDAPRWTRTGQTVPLSSNATPSALQSDGSAPVEMNFRLPPDLYYGTEWASDRPNATLHLDYRYNSISLGPASSLQMRVNGAYIGSIPLASGVSAPSADAARTLHTDVAVPIVDLRPFSNDLSFEFAFQPGQTSDGAVPPVMQGAILGSSWLDLRGYQHWAALPNLQLFSSAGFPFTRFADLSQTTVVLPSAPTAQEIETFLTLIGHFGRQTGFPALRVTVSGPDSLRDGAHTDFLVIGSASDQLAFDKLAAQLPIAFQNGGLQIHNTQDLFARVLNRPIFDIPWLKKLGLDAHPETGSPDSGNIDSGSLALSNPPGAVIEGIESPSDSVGSRSLVAIRIADAADFEPFLNNFLQEQQSAAISGNVAVLRGDGFQSFRIGSATYHVGSLTWLTRAALWFSQVPWLVTVVVFVFAFLLAIWTRNWLRAKARRRLTMLGD